MSLAPGTAPRVLIVKLSSLGDVVHAMAAVQDIRAAVPLAQIDWLVERGFAPLVARCQGVSRVVICNLREWRHAPLAPRTRAQWAQFKAALQQQRYDAVIDLQGLTKSAVLARWARLAPGGRRYGMANATDGSSFEAPARWLVDRAIAVAPRVHVVERSRRVCAAAMGYMPQGPARFGLAVGDAALAAPDNTRPWVVLVHGTSRQDKEWPLAHWLALGQRLNEQGLGVALVHGNERERERSVHIAQALEHAWVWPGMPLDSVVDTMARCAGVIGVDSGLSHIAVALDKPHVQIYNFDTAWRTGVDLAHQRTVYGVPCPTLEQVWDSWQAASAGVCPP